MNIRRGPPHPAPLGTHCLLLAVALGVCVSANATDRRPVHEVADSDAVRSSIGRNIVPDVRANNDKAALTAPVVVVGTDANIVEAVFPPHRAVASPPWIEAVHSVPVAGTGASIVVTSFRPQGAGPFPWIILSHGTASSVQANRAIGRYRPLNPVREWVKRGYAVLVPVRRGYGASGGDTLADDYGSCRRPDFRHAGEAAAQDLLATVDFAKSQRDLDAKRWLLAGQSAGGFASIYTASKRPAGLVAVLAFSPGRGGKEEKRRGEPCAAERMAELIASITPQIVVPVLWFYAENDELFGPPTQKLWFERFRSAGGRGELVVVPPFPERHGHGVFPAPAGIPLWTAAVAGFYKSQQLGLPF